MADDADLAAYAADLDLPIAVVAEACAKFEADEASRGRAFRKPKPPRIPMVVTAAAVELARTTYGAYRSGLAPSWSQLMPDERRRITESCARNAVEYAAALVSKRNAQAARRGEIGRGRPAAAQD